MIRPVRFFKDEQGATAVEYAIMIAMIAAVIIAGVRLIGQNSQSTFNNMADAIGGLGGT